MKYIALLGLLGQAAASACKRRDIIGNQNQVSTSHDFVLSASVSVAASSSLISSTSSTSSTSTSTSLTSTSTSLTTSTSTTSTSTSSSTSSTSTSTTSTSTTTGPVTAITVAPTGPFTAINAAIAYAQSNAIPTVTVKQGTYTESVAIQATAAVTIVGETSAGSGYANNLVTISNAGLAVNYNAGSAAHLGFTWRNINFNNTDSTSTTGVVYLRGSKNAFYSCRFVCAGSICLTGTYSAGLIANSYIDGYDKLVYSYPSLYIYGTTLSASNNNALLVYNQGVVANGAQQNSTVVFDSSAVVQKAGTTNKNVYLAAANSLGGSVVVYRNTSLAGLIAATGAYADTKTMTSPNTYIEFKTSGAGSYANNAALRAGHVQWVTDSSVMAAYELQSFFASVYYTVATTSTSWIDSGVMSQILADDAQQDAAVATTSTTSSSTSTTSTSTTSTALTTTSSSTTSTSLTTTSSSTTAAPTATGCVLPSSVPSTALVVGPVGSCANYSSISAAVAALPVDATTQYIYILGGAYTEQIIFPNGRTGATTFRGESASPLSQAANNVTVYTSGAVLSSAGGSAATGAFQSTQYYTKQLTFYNINFVNTYTPTTNYQAVAVSLKATRAAFYSCGVQSSQGSLLLNYGAFYFSNCLIEGTTDFVWGQGAAYIYNSRIVTDGTTTGQTIAAQQYQSSVGSSFLVFDTCAVVPASSALAKASTYLGRDYSATANVSFVNSYLDAHIAAAGWKIASSTTVKFVEANNSGPGASTSGRPSVVSLLSSSAVYSAAGVLGDVSWLDTSAIAPFAGFPDSVYTVVATTTSATTSATASATVLAAVQTYTVAPTPTAGQYGTVMSAVAALPNDSKAYEIAILAGTYNEQVWVNRTGKVTLRGQTTFVNDYTQNTVTIQFAYGVLTSAGQDELTPVINAKKTDGSGLALYNINFINTNPQASNTAALAADFYGTAMAAYGCSFKGFQDTLLANQGVQVFSNCYIEGSVDFIWGYSKAYFHQCYIASNTAGACITAQNRPSAAWAGGFVFDSCYVTYTSSYSLSGTTYLGRPWSQYAIAVYMNSFLDKHINPLGWNTWSTSSPNTANVTFGEFNNSGPGSWTASTTRASFATNLTESAAASYSLAAWIGSTSWLDTTAYNYVPSYNLTGPVTATTTTPTTAAVWAHPTSGTTPPVGAVLVSINATVAGSFGNLTSALASLPSDSTTQIVFMYPGTYNEQVPALTRAGPVMIIGYSDTAPGSSYDSNQVTITNARGLSVSPVPTGHSNAETATFATTATVTKVSMYNIDIVNSDNLDGALASYVTLAASIYGNHIGFYGCTFIGWQDTLLTGATAGYQYYESCYIEGAIDFIWGYSKAYFKGCTIGAKRAKSAITAHSRASYSAIGGYIFDQCLFTAAPDATVDLTQQVYLGRPYNSYALVVVKNSYLDDTIQPAGWKVWSTTSPNTDHITFAEFNNSGPGNWENNAAAREAFQNCTLLTSDTYPLASVMDSTDWIDLTYWDSIVTPTPAVAPEPEPAVYDGTVPPAGAFIVSKTGLAERDGTVYATIQSALDAIAASTTTASSKFTAIVFIYPGTYTEQLVLNKSGTTIFMGYSDATSDYTKNQVTIAYDYGVDTQSDQSNSDSATVYATGNYFQAVNINFANTFGTTEDYASLGFAVRSSKYAGLYGCQVYGNQDALLINGFLFAYNTYVEGNVDMIWGSGAGYFLNSTISPNEDGVSITADKRATNTTAAGFVFDQCRVTPAGGASFSTVSLGRPWNNLARVAYIESYLGSMIQAAGWSQWSKSSPQTDGVLFGEYGNYGPGAATAGRAAFSTQLTADSAAQFELANFFAATAWINMTLVEVTPFSAGNVTIPVVTATSTSTSMTLTTYLTTTTTTTATTFTIKTTTDVTTTKQTLTATTTAPDTTTTVKTTATLDVGTTITPTPALVVETTTTTDKTTVTSVVTITEPVETVTAATTTTLDVGTTVTPAVVLKTTTTTSTDVASTTKSVTVAAATSTVKSSTTITSTVTTTPKVVTTTVSMTITVLSTATTTAKAVSVTSTSTVTVGSTDATTTTAKATTSTSTVFTTTTKTTSKTTTLSCVPTVAKRGLEEYNVEEVRELAARELEARALAYVTTTSTAAATKTTTTTAYTTFSTVVKTTVATIPGVTYTTTSASTKTTGKTSTIKPTTTVVTVTTESVATKYSTTTLKASTVTVSSTATKTTGKTTTLKTTTSTDIVSVVVSTTTTATKSTTLPAVTTTSVNSVTKTTTTTLPAVTSTKTTSKTTTVKSTVTVPATTTTKWKTTTTTLKPTTTITVQSTVLKTTTSKVTVTTTSTATTTKKGAAACTA